MGKSNRQTGGLPGYRYPLAHAADLAGRRVSYFDIMPVSFMIMTAIALVTGADLSAGRDEMGKRTKSGVASVFSELG